MKKLVALILVFVMTIGLSVNAFASDGQQTTTISVVVAPGTYTVTVPEDITFNLTTILNSNPQSETNKIGEVTVSDVSNCRYVKCVATAPELKNGENVLPCEIYGHLPVPASSDVQEGAAYNEIRFYPWPTTFSANSGSATATWYPYFTGRSLLSGQDALWHFTPTMSVKLYLVISESMAENAEPGTYAGTMTFVFSSSNKNPLS